MVCARARVYLLQRGQTMAEGNAVERLRGRGGHHAVHQHLIARDVIQRHRQQLRTRCKQR